MRILISAHLFWPSIGGIEQVAGLLATEWARLGHEVTVLTTTPAVADRARPFTVVRAPRCRDTIAAIRWCDVYFQNHISLRTLWPVAMIPRPVVVTYQTWLTRADGRRGWQDALKRAAARAVSRNVAISRAVADSIGVPCTIIPNPYDDEVFIVRPEIPRTRDIIVVARLVSDKGVDLCLLALALLARRGLRPRLTIVGIGPEESRLRARAATLDLASQIDFVGRMTGHALAACLNAHRLLVIPSRWDEPFGIVALEGLACGCTVVGSRGGGLPEALGPSGLTFPARDATALADQIANTLSAPRTVAVLPECTRQHLRAHGRRAVADAYLHLFRQVCAPRSP